MATLKKQMGFTLLELAVASIIIGILAVILLNRLQYYQEAAERTRMESTASAIKNALRMEMAGALVAGRPVEYDRLIRENPIDWLETKPGNYLGAYRSPDPGQFPRGNWYFDQDRRELVYLIRQGDYFRPDSAGQKQVRYSVKLSYNPGQNGTGPQISSITLRETEPYRWFKP